MIWSFNWNKLKYTELTGKQTFRLFGLLADEPTGNLDRATEEKVLSLMKETSERFRQTVIMITHNEKIAAYADKCLHIEDGVLIG